MLLPGAKGFVNIHAQLWRFRQNNIFHLLLVLIVLLVPYAASTWDPYEVLGVKQNANSDQIKRAYRDLARRYHPDKSVSSENDSGKRFIEINKAFDILKDPAKKARFDQHGTVDESRHSRGHHHGNNMHHYNYHHRHGRENWSAHNGFRTFSFYTSSRGAADSYFRRKSINTRQYLNNYLEESKLRPHLAFFYTDFCPSCLMIESIWVKITDELAKYNVGSFTMNVHMESRLAHELGVNSVPHIACLLDGHLHHYYQTEISLASFVRFIKSLLPDNLIILLRTVDAQDRYISQTMGESNKLKAIIINDEKNLKLRYLLLAYSLRHYYQFAHVSTKLCEYKSLAKHYNLSIGVKSQILTFDERIDSPRTHIQYESEKFSTDQFTRDLLVWPFLRLPRLTSQRIFDDLCLYSTPRDGDKVVQKLCVILLAPMGQSSLPARNKLLEFIESNNLSRDKRVAFAYICPSRQSEFIESIIRETVSNQPETLRIEPKNHLVLIQRQPASNRKGHYRWIKHRWNPAKLDELEKAKLDLYQCITAYREGSFELKDKFLLNTLEDEERPGLLERIYSRFVGGIARALYYVITRESFSTVIILIGCALLTSLFLYKSPVPMQYTSQESNFQYSGPPESDASYMTKSRSMNNSLNSPTDSELNVMELKAETFNGMIRLLKPGFRSIILLTDNESRDSLVKKFKKSVWPYRRNRTLLFGYLCLDKNLDWYKKLLEQVLGRDNLRVNKKNCIGTVLSLNGFKKYFRVYHAKHNEFDTDEDGTDNDGSFLGFDEKDEHYRSNDLELGFPENSANETRPNVVYTVDNLLDKLPIWLDKMFDGLTKRYFVDEWPEKIQ